MFGYRHPIESNKLTFFNEVSNTLNKAVKKYDNILVKAILTLISLILKWIQIITYVTSLMLFP